LFDHPGIRQKSVNVSQPNAIAPWLRFQSWHEDIRAHNINGHFVVD